MSSIIAISDAIVALLTTGNNSGWFPMPISTIERRWAPDYEISDVADLRVAVVPRVEARARITRIADDFTATVDIGLMRHLPASSNIHGTTPVDAYATMAQAIGGILARDQLPNLPDVRLTGIIHDPLIDQERLTAHRAIFSILSTTWRYLAPARVALPA